MLHCPKTAQPTGRMHDAGGAMRRMPNKPNRLARRFLGIFNFIFARQWAKEAASRCRAGTAESRRA